MQASEEPSFPEAAATEYDGNRNMDGEPCIRMDHGVTLSAPADAAPQRVRNRIKERFAPSIPAAEIEFYETYEWSLNPYPTVAEAIEFLRREIARLATVPPDWRAAEVSANVVLLASGILNCTEEYLRGVTVRPAGRLTRLRAVRTAVRLGDLISNNVLARRRIRARRWRERWVSALHPFIVLLVAGQPTSEKLCAAAQPLLGLLGSPLPPALLKSRLSVPSPFGRLDLTQNDVTSMGRLFAERSADRSQKLLIVGLRTSGSYFGPWLKAVLEMEGFASVSLITIEPSKGPGRWEARDLRRYAKLGCSALIVDDPPHSGGTIFSTFEILRKAGFAFDRIGALVPSHPAKRNWFKPLAEDLFVILPPEDWQKRKLLEAGTVQERLAEYFASDEIARIIVADCDRSEGFQLRNSSPDERNNRLKRIFEVSIETRSGQRERCYVLAKSVGWGWYGYRAFLAGHRLTGFVPPILGLRDGILYMLWIPQNSSLSVAEDRDRFIDRAASYVAARVSRLKLDPHSVAGFDVQRHNNAHRLLEKALSRVYGHPTGTLARSHMGQLLREQLCSLPTLIDGNMQPAEWVRGPDGVLKTDYEHHGMGKGALNVVDPAYDLAEVVLSFALSRQEEDSLIRRYIETSGDEKVGDRLFLSKLLAGIWAMNQAQEQLFAKPSSALAAHRRFMAAWDFLTVQAARYCGSFYGPPQVQRWRSPIVALDIDGVIDRRLLGFPCTTMAGIEALAMLAAHEYSVIVNTARSVSEVKSYCEAYSLSGGVAEHGSFMWDAAAGRGEALISVEARRQLEELRRRLRSLPGVFLDERHLYSIRAFTYQKKPPGVLASLVRSASASDVGDGALSPLPAVAMSEVVAELGLDELSVHETTIDTTVVAKHVDKGTGLAALSDRVLGAHAETIAIGDHEQDLTMFRVATRCYAPANIQCPGKARLLGCRIARQPYQRGLLEIVRELTGRPEHKSFLNRSAREDVFLRMLKTADRGFLRNLMDVLSSGSAFRIFLR